MSNISSNTTMASEQPPRWMRELTDESERPSTCTTRKCNRIPTVFMQSEKWLSRRKEWIVVREYRCEACFSVIASLQDIKIGNVLYCYTVPGIE